MVQAIAHSFITKRSYFALLVHRGGKCGLVILNTKNDRQILCGRNVNSFMPLTKRTAAFTDEAQCHTFFIFLLDAQADARDGAGCNAQGARQVKHRETNPPNANPYH